MPIARVTRLAWCLALALAAAPADPALERGMRAFRQHDLAAAEAAFRQAVQERPESAGAARWLGMTLAAQEKYAAAEPQFRKACTLDAREQYACYYLGRTLYTLARLPEARAAFETALRNPGEDGRAAYGLALVLEAMNLPAEAEPYYRQAIAKGEARARIDFGMMLCKTGRPAEGLAMLREAAARLPEAKPYLERMEKSFANAPPRGARTQPSPIRFDESTLDMLVRNGARGDKHLVETVLGGVAVFDYDNDGWPDIYVANGAALPSLQKTDASYSNRLFRNNHDGTFTDVTAKAGVGGAGYSMGVAAADYDNDGWTDLFVTGVRSQTLYRNRGDGAFEDVTARAGLQGDGSWSVAAGWFDSDNDGLLDLFVVRYVAWDPGKEVYCGARGPGQRMYCHPSYYAPLANALYHNEGHGVFRDVSAESGIAGHKGKGMSLAFGDIDGDGRLDVFVANDTLPNFLFHNEGGGKFREIGLEAGVAYGSDGKTVSAMGSDFRDYDNDGREDLFVTTLSNEGFLLFRNLGGRFSEESSLAGVTMPSTPWTGWGAALVDLNNDGYKDIFAANGHVMDNAERTSSRKSRQPNLVFANRGDGSFAASTLAGEAFHRAAAFGDFDRDGRMDAVVVRLNERPLLLRNVSAARHWIGLRLTGTRSNRDGIGAMVHIVTASGEQWNRVATAGGYGSSSEPAVHFGLGEAASIRTIEIRWPSGVVQKLNDIAADRYLEIREAR